MTSSETTDRTVLHPPAIARTHSPSSRRRCLTAWWAALLLVAGSASAQTGRSTVSGRVVDATGLPVAGVSVTLSRPAAAIERGATTNTAGAFEFADMPEGSYSISAVLAGFSVAHREVTVSRDAVTVDLVLQPGSFVEEVSVIASRLVGSEEVLRRTPGSVDILAQDVLEASHVFTTTEAMRKVPGVVVRDEEGAGLRPNIGIRGLNPTRSSKALLLEDGVPTTYAPYGDNASYYHPPIERFSRIEVLKGSGQIAYGPVTVGGVVNYITPEPPSVQSTTVEIEGGNRGFLSAHGGFGGTWGRTGLLFDVMRKQSDGARENQHSTLNDVTGKWVRQVSQGRSFSLKGNYYGEDSQVGYSGLRDDEYRADPRQNPFRNDHFDGDRGGVSGVFSDLLRPNLAFTTTAYAQVFRRHWWRQSSNSSQRPNDSSDPACGGMANLNTTCGNEGRLRQYYLFGVEPRLRISHEALGGQETDAGLRLHFEDQDRRQENGGTPMARTGVLVEDNHRTASAVSAFVQHRFVPDRWTVTPGVRVERIQYARTNRLANDGAGASGDTALTEVIPGLGVAYAVDPQSTVFAGLHKGFAPPRVEDIINNNTGGVVELDPERSWNVEVGARSLVAGGIRVDGTFFQMDYENQIVPASLAGGVGATLTNGGETLHRGVEIGSAFDSEAISNAAHGVYARVAYTWIPVARFTGVRFSSVPGFASVSVSGNRLPYAPETLATVTLGYRHASGFDVQVESHTMSQQFGDDLNTIAGTSDGQRGLIPSLTLWNAAATWRVKALRSAFFVAVKNLADSTAIVDRARGILPTSPRLVQFGTTVRF